MENLAFTNRVISTLKSDHKNCLYRSTLLDYLVRVNRILYCRELDLFFVKELDGMHVGWYVDFKRVYQ